VNDNVYVTFTLELRPEIEAQIREHAQARGLAVEEYLQTVIEDVVQPRWVPRLSPDEMRAALDKLADVGRELPDLPDSALTRESFYADRD
jgi:hypothetical protein